MSLRGFPQNIDISPNNWQNLKLVKDFTNRSAGVKVEVDGFKLTREGYEAMFNWLASQGITESPEAYFTAPSGQVYNLFMDISTLDEGLDDYTCDLKMRGDNENFFYQLERLSWKTLRNEQFITDDMLVDFPYLVVPDDLRAQKAIQLITLASILFQLYITIKEIADTAALLLNPTNAAVFATQAISLGIYLGLTIASLIQTLINLQELYFPFVRYYKCISDLDLMTAACSKLGYTFISDFMTNERANVYTIGKPQQVANSTLDFLDNFFTNTYLNEGYPRLNDTGGRDAAALFNEYLSNYDIDIFVYDNVVRMERSSFFEQTAPVEVKPVLSNPEENDDRSTFNFEELWGRKYYRWSDDENDAHSKDVNKGNVRFEAITTQINTINEDLVRLNGLDENISPYALVKRKNSYTGTENLVRGLFAEFQDIIGQLGGGNPILSSLVTERIGVGVFEKDYWTVTRKVWGTPELDTTTGRTVLRQDDDFLDYLGQDAINEIFNTGLYVANNTFRFKTLPNLPFTDENFVNLLQNNRVNYEGEADGAKVLRIEWFPFQYYCNMDVELRSEAGNNTQVTIL